MVGLANMVDATQDVGGVNMGSMITFWQLANMLDARKMLGAAPGVMITFFQLAIMFEPANRLMLRKIGVGCVGVMITFFQTCRHGCMLRKIPGTARLMIVFLGLQQGSSPQDVGSEGQQITFFQANMVDATQEVGWGGLMLTPWTCQAEVECHARCHGVVGVMITFVQRATPWLDLPCMVAMLRKMWRWAGWGDITACNMIPRTRTAKARKKKKTAPLDF